MRYSFLLLILFIVLWRVVPAGAAPTILSNQAIVDFPNQITFQLELAAGSNIRQAVLNYDTLQNSCLDVSSQVTVEVTGDKLEWTWEMVRSGNPPPGSQVWWEWTLTEANGTTTTTPRQTVNLEDSRFNWRTVTAERVHLHWYAGDEVGQLLLDAATAGLAQLEAEMGLSLQSDVQFFIYGRSEDMREAVLYIQNWAGGVAFSEYNTILIGVPPTIAADWGRETVRHELAHLVLGQFGWSCVGGGRPTWLEEGFAMYAQGEPTATITADLENGIENNAFSPLRSLNGAFPAHDSAASLAYSQSYSVVAFLLDDYGQEKLQQLILALAEGISYDAALEQVYGFNVDGLEMAWRQSIGAPARQIPPTPTPITAAHIPTVAPASLVESMPTPPSANATAVAPAGGSPAPTTCTLSFIPLLAIALFRKRKPNHTPDL